MSTVVADIYARISEAQATERAAKRAGGSDDSAAVERQLAECREYIAARGWTEGRVWVDDDVSASKGLLRPAFEGVVAAAPDVLVVWHVDRLVRVNTELETVINTGMSVHAVKAGHLDLSTPAGRAVARTVVAWAQYEGEQKALRQVARNEQDRAAGRPYWRRRPFGMTVEGEPLEPEAQAVREAYRAALDGASLGSIARDWNARGLKPVQGAEKFSGVVVRGILLAPRNAGILTYRREEVGQGSWTPLVDLETFRAVEQTLKEPGRFQKGGGRRANLLTGVALCGTCLEKGEEVSVIRTNLKRSGDPRYGYACRVTRHNQYPQIETDNTVIGQTLAVLTSGGAAVLDDSDKDKADELRMEAASIRGQLTEWEAAASALGPAEYLRITGALRERLAGVQDALTAITADTLLVTEDGREWTNAEVVDHALEQWNALPLAKRQALLERVWSRIVLTPRNGKRFKFTMVRMEPAEGVTVPE